MKMLNLRQIQFVQRYIETKNATQAALDAYGYQSRNVAGVAGYRLLRSVKVGSAIERILDDAGLSDKAIARKLKEEIAGWSSIKAIKLALKLHGFQNI